MRYLLKVQYDGSKFYGFQRLNDERSVQRELEEALNSFTKEDVKVKGAGRTDKGVHALMQCVTFDLNKNFEPSRMMYLLNRKLSKYIYILSCEQVPLEFHARFSVKEKTYIYKINIGKYSPLLADYYYQNSNINIKKLRKVSKFFIGIHDFKNFISGDRKNTKSVIYNINIKKRKNIVYIIFKGKSFYRYMVRNMVGAMLDYNNGNASLEEITNMINHPEVKKQLLTAPSEGLYLADIKY